MLECQNGRQSDNDAANILPILQQCVCKTYMSADI